MDAAWPLGQAILELWWFCSMASGSSNFGIVMFLQHGLWGKSFWNCLDFFFKMASGASHFGILFELQNYLPRAEGYRIGGMKNIHSGRIKRGQNIATKNRHGRLGGITRLMTLGRMMAILLPVEVPSRNRSQQRVPQKQTATCSDQRRQSVKKESTCQQQMRD